MIPLDGHLHAVIFPGHPMAAPQPIRHAYEPHTPAPIRARPGGIAAELRALGTQPLGRPNPAAWVMPRFRNRDICDQVDHIAALKRKGELEAALELAIGCMNAMARHARNNPAVAMEHYIIEPCIILTKMKRPADEIEIITAWLDLKIPAQREDHRIKILKRLAKAQERLAKQEGRDPAPHAARWHELVAMEKRLKSTKSTSGTSATGRGRMVAALGSPAGLNPSPQMLAAPEFVAVDFETANRRGGLSACQIALVKIRRGRIIDRFTTFIRPPSGWDHFEFTWLHGISARDTARAPMWDELVMPVTAFTNGMPVYAHNASFDARVWRELDQYFGTNSLPTNFFCTLQLSRRMIGGLPDYKLPTVVGACVPGYRFNHHRADADAEACGLIVAHLQSLI